MSDKTYNGWTNYETWRVNLEIFDGQDLHDLIGSPKEWEEPDAYEIGKILADYAEEVVFAGCHYDERGQTNLMQDYARAFLQDVNWYEIAEHLIAASSENEVTE